MSLDSTIQRILDQRLEGVSNVPLIAYENVNFKEIHGTAWLRPRVLTGESTIETFDRKTGNPGVYTIEVFVENQKGTKEFNEIVGSIRDHFALESTLIDGNVELWVQSISKVSPTPDDIWFKGAIDINFIVYTS